MGITGTQFGEADLRQGSDFFGNQPLDELCLLGRGRRIASTRQGAGVVLPRALSELDLPRLSAARVDYDGAQGKLTLVMRQDESAASSELSA